MGEMAEKVHFIQDSLQTLDTNLGHLQDTSAMAVDTLGLLAASDDCQQRAALYSLHRPISSSHPQVLHSWCLPKGGSVPPSRYLLAHKPYSSTPPSLLGGVVAGQQSLPHDWQPQRDSEASEEDSGEELYKSKTPPVHGGALGDISSTACCCHRRHSHDSPGGWRDRTPLGSCGTSRTGTPLVPWSTESPDQQQQQQPRAWHHDSHLPPSQEESPNEIEEEEEDDQEEEFSNSAEMSLSRTSSHAVLLSDSPADRGKPVGLVNLGFSGDDELAPNQSGSKQRCRKFPRWMYRLRNSRSLSASVENMAFVGALPGSPPPPALAGESPCVGHVSHDGEDTLTALNQNRGAYETCFHIWSVLCMHLFCCNEVS